MQNNNKKDYKKELQNKINEFAKELCKLTNEIKFNEKFLKFIDFQKKFWNYSLYNQILINLQYPNASYIAGFKKWKELNRNVKAGSKAIWILAPQIYKNEYDKEQVIITFKDNGKIEFIDIDVIVSDQPYLTGFKSVPVFDVSQTKGEKLPDVDYRLHTNDRPELLDKYEKMLKDKGIILVYKPLSMTCDGFTDGKKIIVNSNNSIDDKFQTGIHEYLHFTNHFKSKDNGFTRDELEIQAEACSYIVCRFLGIRSKGYNYIALYNSDSKKILQALKNINRAIKDIIIELGVSDFKNDRMSKRKNA